MILSTDQPHDEAALNACAEKLADIMMAHLATMPAAERKRRMEAAEKRIQEELMKF